MISEEKIKEIHKLLRRGEPAGEVRERLLKEGYSEADLKMVFKPHHYDMRGWYMTFGILVLLVGIYLGSLLVMLLGILLFVAYNYEVKRLEKLSSNTVVPLEENKHDSNNH